MKILRDIGCLATCRDLGGQSELEEIDSAALVWEGGEILWVGPEADLQEEYGGSASGAESLSAGGRLVVPGLVDCHTHLAFAGSRAGEFEQRVLGVGYLEIARQGGGIASTVRDTRAASEGQLVDAAEPQLAEMLRLGVTTVECKSGYGLATDEELKLLRVYRRLRQRVPQRLVSTFLGAHVVPPELRDERDAYVDLVCEEMIPAVASEGPAAGSADAPDAPDQDGPDNRLASFCDVFVEEGAFSPEEARRILAVAAEAGMRAKLHVDQLSDVGGGELAAEVGAISADHLEHTSESGIAAMAEAGVVAVSLPFASFFLRQPAMRARAFLDAGVTVAVATDFNPGSAPSHHLPLAMLMASVMQGLTAAEVLQGATRIAARAIGLESEVGSLEPGKAADFVVVDAPSVRDWLFRFRANAAVEVFVGGEPRLGGLGS